MTSCSHYSMIAGMKGLWLLLVFLALPLPQPSIANQAGLVDGAVHPLVFQITGTPAPPPDSNQPTPTYLPLPTVTFIYPTQVPAPPSLLMGSERSGQPVSGPVKEPGRSLVRSPWTLAALVTLGVFWVVLLVFFLAWRRNRL